MSNINGDLYGLGSIASVEGFEEEEEEEEGERDRARMAAYGTEPGVFRAGGSSPSAISDAVSIIAADIHRRGSASLASAGVRERIASHPLFPKLLGAYLDCRKVGAPPEIATELEEIRRDSRTMTNAVTVTSDRALDDFMETYCDILTKYKSDLSRPFDEATSFLSEMQSQLNDLISNPSGSSTSYVSDHEALGNSSEEEYLNVDEVARSYEERELKEKLLREYSGYITNLKLEFSKKKKTGKLPKDATKILLDWWTLHSRWPYPTEGDKIALGELTGLDQKQINNWFINQRKRHWKPPDNNMHVTLMDSHSLYGPLYHL